MSTGTNLVRSDNATVRELVGAMFDLVVAHGGSVHPKLWVAEREGSMSVHVDGSDDELLMRVPAEILVPVDRVQIEAVGDELVVVTPDEAMTAVQHEALDKHLRLYNATAKVAWARAMLPDVALAGNPVGPDVMDRLRHAGARRGRSVAAAFLATRTLGLRIPASPAASGATGTDPTELQGDGEAGAARRPVLMPLLELVNHHPHGSPFGGSARGLRATVAHPVGGTEVYVRYDAHDDVIDMALRYGFVGDDARRTRVCPVQVEVSGLRVIIESSRRRATHPFDPPGVTVEGSTLTLSHLSIDADHPQRTAVALSMAVQMAARSAGAALSGETVSADAVLAEIVRADREVTDSVLADLALTGPAGATIERAVAAHRAIIDGVR